MSATESLIVNANCKPMIPIGLVPELILLFCFCFSEKFTLARLVLMSRDLDKALHGKINVYTYYRIYINIYIHIGLWLCFRRTGFWQLRIVHVQ